MLVQTLHMQVTHLGLDEMPPVAKESLFFSMTFLLGFISPDVILRFYVKAAAACFSHYRISLPLQEAPSGKEHGGQGVCNLQVQELKCQPPVVKRA